MFTKETATLLQKSLTAVPKLVLARSLKHDIDELVAEILPAGKLAIIDDRHTAEALGTQALRGLKGRFDCLHVTLDAPAAEQAVVEELRRKASRADALIAVGSGTISDLCKYAAYLDKKPYIVFPTAASMNGYLSANASITVEGYKKTVAAKMPLALFCDLSVIVAAPPRLNKSGLGDSLARPTAQADWLLSHLLLGTAYNEVPFELLKPLEPQLHEQARGIAKGDAASLELLMQTLLLSGLGMTIAGGSYPASQGEHMIAHAYGMLQPSKHFHGEEIAVTTLYMARLQEKLLRHAPSLRLPLFDAEKMAGLLGKKTTKEAKKVYAAKLALTPPSVTKEKWESIASQIEKVMLPSAKIESILKAADCPDRPEALGWDVKTFDIAVHHARFLRDRFTFLDLQS